MGAFGGQTVTLSSMHVWLRLLDHKNPTACLNGWLKMCSKVLFKCSFTADKVTVQTFPFTFMLMFLTSRQLAFKAVIAESWQMLSDCSPLFFWVGPLSCTTSLTLNRTALNIHTGTSRLDVCKHGGWVQHTQTYGTCAETLSSRNKNQWVPQTWNHRHMACEHDFVLSEAAEEKCRKCWERHFIF